jgi:drug/metabolite transporter (DMT)-like permease
MPRDRRLVWQITLAFAVSCLIWGSTWMAVRILVTRVPPFQVAAARFFLAAIILMGISRWRRLAPPRSAEEWKRTLILGITMMAIPYLCVFWAEQYVTSSMTAVLFSSFPLAATVMTHLMTEHRVSRRAVLAMLVGFAAIAWLFRVELSATRETAIGGVLVLASVVSGAWATVYAQRERLGLHPISSTGWQVAVAFLATGLMSWLFEPHSLSGWTWPLFGLVVLLALFGSALVFVLYYWLLEHLRAYQLGTLDLITPFIAIAEGAWILDEVIPPGMVAVAVTVAAMVYFLLRADRPAAEVGIQDTESHP